MQVNANIVQRLGISLPIIQAPMAGVQGHALAAAVCEAGGLGSIPAASLSSEALAEELRSLQGRTEHPYNVNFFCHHPPQPNAERSSNWVSLLSPYYQEFGLSTDAPNPGPVRRPFDQESLAVLAEFKPAVVSFHFGLPSSDLLQQLRSWGTKIFSSATTLAEAQWLEANGVDAIIAQGLEAGGHRGMFLTQDLSTQIGTFALIPQIARTVNIPVLAAGGIADAHGVAAALKLGATAVQIGTAYLLCPEALTPKLHRLALQSPSVEQHTAITNLFTGRPARSIVNRLMRELGPLSDAVPDFPLAAVALAPLRAYAESKERGDFTPLWSGQNASGCTERSAYDLTVDLAGQL